MMPSVNDVPMYQVGAVQMTDQYYYDDDDSDKILRKRVVQTIIDLICIIISFAAFILVYFFVDPKIRGFYCNETDIFYPLRDNTVEFWVVGIYGTLGPLVFIVIVELLNSKIIRCKKKFDDEEDYDSNNRRTFIVCTIHAVSLFILGIGICLLVTEIGKRWIGRLRPHFIAECQPDLASINCTFTSGIPPYLFHNYVDTSGSFCKGDAKKVKEARLSFPSGHSSYSWYTMIFLIVYLEARLYLLRFRFLKPMIQMTALIAAYVTTLSRVSDYHHRASDVIGGMVLGCVIGFFMTLVAGRVLWVYGRKAPYHDFDLKPARR